MYPLYLLYLCIYVSIQPTFQKKHYQSNVVENEYIVQFREYDQQEYHKQFLNEVLGNNINCPWYFIERNNIATNSFPTDFSLIKLVSSTDSHLCIEALRKHVKVKCVVPQRRFEGETLEAGEVESNLSSTNFNGTSSKSYRMHTKFSLEEEESYMTRKLHSTFQIPELFNAHLLWEKHFTGTGIKVAVFDTGLREYHPHFRRVIDITNWTDESSKEDGLGHGTFVAGVIASQFPDCLGLAPDSDLYIFKVFTNSRVSYTTWFLDAFNYAIFLRINVLNLSIGGPDFLDMPFVEKVLELSANNIIVVSAIGNDGPLYGTLNNPADQLDVIGVGGIDFGEKLASFSSRGMTTWELPHGYGRAKPDILAFGQSVQGSRIYGGCRALSGTSVASPVVTGAIALLASTISGAKRWDILNPASMKQVLLESAEIIPDAHLFEQGAGKLNILGAYEKLSQYVPRLSCFPSSLDLTKCPYMWPYCTQPLYYSSLPIIVNVTILNGMGVYGEITKGPSWIPGSHGDLLEISFTHSVALWPWTGYLATHIRVSNEANDWEGDAEGVIIFTARSPPALGETEFRESTVELPLRVHIVPTPSRSKRILWDQFHNLRYPSGYFPRDSLDVKDEPFDWNGDHIHTNFKDLYRFLRDHGYFIEVLGHPLTCFDAHQYGTLMIVDTEDEFFDAEISKVYNDIEKEGLSMIIVGDWYNSGVMKKINFFDENTRQWWTPATGGANVPALNDLLTPFNIAFGEKIFSGEFLAEQTSYFASGSSIIRFPSGGSLLYAVLQDQSADILSARNEKENVPIVGVWPTDNNLILNRTLGGRIAVFGDSSCLDDTRQKGSCFWLLEKLIKFTATGTLDKNLHVTPLHETFNSGTPFPERLEGSDLQKYSKVIEHSATCTRLDFRKWNRTEGELLVINWEKSRQDSSSGNGKFVENLPRGPVKEPTPGGVSELFLPYLVGCVVILFLVAIALKMRKDQLTSKRIQV